MNKYILHLNPEVTSTEDLQEPYSFVYKRERINTPTDVVALYAATLDNLLADIDLKEIKSITEEIPSSQTTYYPVEALYYKEKAKVEEKYSVVKPCMAYIMEEHYLQPEDIFEKEYTMHKNTDLASPICGYKDSAGTFHDTEKEAIVSSLVRYYWNEANLKIGNPSSMYPVRGTDLLKYVFENPHKFVEVIKQLI